MLLRRNYSTSRVVYLARKNAFVSRLRAPSYGKNVTETLTAVDDMMAAHHAERVEAIQDEAIPQRSHDNIWGGSLYEGGDAPRHRPSKGPPRPDKVMVERRDCLQ